MLKIQPRTIPGWAWLYTLLAPSALLVTLLWFLTNEALRASAVAQIVLQAMRAGLLNQPDVESLTHTALSGSGTLSTLCVIIGAISFLPFAIIVLARRADADRWPGVTAKLDQKSA